MKKTIFAAFATLAAAFTSCMSEEDTMFQPYETSLATIELNVSNNPELSVWTRGVTNVNNSELGKWYAKVDAEDSYRPASQIGNKGYTAGDHTIYVRSHSTEDDAYTANSGAGAPYYVGSETVNLQKGINNVNVACGQAKNAKITVNNWNTAEINGVLDITSVVADQKNGENNTRSYTYANGGEAFFRAGQAVTLTLNYTYQSVENSATTSIPALVAAKNYNLTIESTDNGKITTLTITYDNTFDNGGTTTIEIDAATGTSTTQSSTNE